jgi:hypothetical protein
LATNRPVTVRGLAAAAADRDGAAVRFGAAAARVGEAALAAGFDTAFEAADFDATFKTPVLLAAAVPAAAAVAGADAEATTGAAGFAGAGFGDAAFAAAAWALPAGGCTVLGVASSAASALVASPSWRRRFSTLARALAIALSRFTSASARRNEPVAEFRLPVPFFAMDMTLPRNAPTYVSGMHHARLPLTSRARR